jgi:MoaA/NifB/PqqE/SkfB family radical SAM enzyme
VIRRSTRKLTVAVVLLQPECNMSCSFCVTEDDFEPLAYPAALGLLDDLARRGVRSVVFGGGEPLTWPGNVLRLAGEARDHGLLVQIGTNGVALPDGFAALDCVDRWVLPLESTDPEVHEAMRQYTGGHHALLLDRLGALRDAGKSVTLSTVLTAGNLDGLEELACFLRGYHAVAENVHAWHLYQFLPLGRGGRPNRERLMIPEESYRAACARIKRLDLPFRVFVRSDMYRATTVEFFWSQNGRIRSGAEFLHDPTGQHAQA